MKLFTFQEFLYFVLNLNYYKYNYNDNIVNHKENTIKNIMMKNKKY